MVVDTTDVPALSVEDVPVSRLNPALYNPRVMDESMLMILVAGIQEFGFVEPLVVNRDRTVIGGHQRLAAAVHLGMRTVPVVWVDLDKPREKALNLALNKVQGRWHTAKLKDLLEDLDTGAMDLEITGFSEGEIEELLTYVSDGTLFPPLIDDQSSTMNTPGETLDTPDVLPQYKWTIYFPQEAQDLVRSHLESLQAELPELSWKEGKISIPR